MSPQVERIKLPAGYTLQQCQVCSPCADERPTLRDEQGRVLAVVEQWRPN